MTEFSHEAWNLELLDLTSIELSPAEYFPLLDDLDRHSVVGESYGPFSTGDPDESCCGVTLMDLELPTSE